MGYTQSPAGQIYAARYKYEAIASGLLGAPARFDFEDFTFGLFRWLPGNGAGGTTTVIDNAEPTAQGVLVASTAASAGSAAVVQGVGGGADINLSAPGWYIAHRSKLTTAVTATTQAFAGVVDQGAFQTILSGFCGPLNASNFVAQYGGSFTTGSVLDSGVPVDTSWHVHEMWGIGNVLNYRIDSRPPVSVTTSWAAYTGAPRAVIRVLDTVGAAIRQMKMDWYAVGQVAA